MRMGREMPESCRICGVGGPGKDPVLCPECAHLLRWVRAYFVGFLLDLGQITTETKFSELGVDSLDYMNWVLEAEEKLGVDIADEDAESIHTVGQFLRYLRARGASWPPDSDLRLARKGGCFRNYVWERVDHRQPPSQSGKPLLGELTSGVYDRDLDG
jgi:acyl carrier protein